MRAAAGRESAAAAGARPATAANEPRRDDLQSNARQSGHQPRSQGGALFTRRSIASSPASCGIEATGAQEARTSFQSSIWVQLQQSASWERVT